MGEVKEGMEEEEEEEEEVKEEEGMPSITDMSLVLSQVMRGLSVAQGEGKMVA